MFFNLYLPFWTVITSVYSNLHPCVNQLLITQGRELAHKGTQKGEKPQNLAFVSEI